MDIINAITHSSHLMSDVINNLNSGVFVIDEHYRLMSLNKQFSDRVEVDILGDSGRICNKIIGCVNADLATEKLENIEYCSDCELMAAVRRAIEQDLATTDQTLVRQLGTTYQPVRKYYRYNCKPLVVDGYKIALLMVDDITSIEEQRAELYEQNTIIHKLNDKFKQDLALAKVVQKSIIPKEPVELNGYRIDFLYFPLEAIGGDMFDIFVIDDRHIGVFMCDVVGHGLPAALLTTMVKALLASYSDLFEYPRQLVNKLNNQLVEMVGEPYMTAFYGLLDTDAHTFKFVRAGHPFPWKLNGAIQTFGHHSNPMIGIDPKMNFSEEMIRLQANDKVMLYTDGLLDAGTDQGNYESRLIQLFDSNATGTGTELLSLMKNDLISNVVYDNHMDDICILMIEQLTAESHVSAVATESVS